MTIVTRSESDWSPCFFPAGLVPEDGLHSGGVRRGETGQAGLQEADEGLRAEHSGGGPGPDLPQVECGEKLLIDALNGY